MSGKQHYMTIQLSKEQGKHAQLDLHAAITPSVEHMLQVQSEIHITSICLFYDFI